jgi:hypothetical protein
VSINKKCKLDHKTVDGVIHERMSPYSPQSNEVAEKKNHTLTALVNSILDTAKLSKAWWG